MKFGKAAPSSSSNAWHIDHGSGREGTQKGQSKSHKLGRRTKPSEQKTQNHNHHRLWRWEKSSQTKAGSGAEEEKHLVRIFL